MELQKIPNELPVRASTKDLINFIATNNVLAIKETTQKFMERGKVKYLDLLRVPSSDRLKSLVETWGPRHVHEIIIALLTKFQNAINVGQSFNTEQIIEAAADIMTEAIEYNLSLEDLVVFFDQAKIGKFGKIYNRLDTQVVMAFLDNYLDQRFEALVEYREEEAIRYRSPSREVDKMRSGLSNFGTSLGNMKNFFKKT